MSFNEYTIIYGFDNNIINFIKDEKNVILIEPRKNVIDLLLEKKTLTSNVSFIKKCLCISPKNETIIYEKSPDCFTLNDENEVSNESVDFKNFKKYNVFVTSLLNIILDYNIQNIKSIVINIDISNIYNVIQHIYKFNQIISHIHIKKNIYDLYFESHLQDNKSIIYNFTNTLKDAFYKFDHKNLNIELPKIAMYCQDNLIESPNMQKLINQYNITPLTIDLSYNIHSGKKSKVIIHEWIKIALKKFFELEKNNNENKYEIFFIFNSNYLIKNFTFPILYPVKNEVLYINKEYDIIYGSKNCMFMLYEILDSDYFLDFIELEKKKRKNLFYIFSKNIFYDYISKIFVLKETFN